MATFDTIWNEIFNKIQKNGEDALNTVAAQAEYIGISAAQISRIKSGKSSLTDNVIESIVKKVSEFDQEYAKTLTDKLKKVQFESIKENLGITGRHEVVESLVDKYSIKKAEELFEKLSNSKSLLCVDYRDFPQATIGGSYPVLAERAGEAVKKGLRFALFQPFGTAESLREMISKLNKQLEHPKVMVTLKAYMYLYELTIKVRQVYSMMKEISKGGLGQIVLYEAQIKEPMITAIGLQSRLFLANYFEGNLHQKQIFEWVTAPNNEHFFIERSQLSLDLDAVGLQFHPIHKFWEENKTLPENIKENKKENIREKTELSDAYKSYALETLLGKGIVRWQNWSELKEER
ncbi:MAG TPA: hypothetical protein VF648_05355 [Pyrinomonadaceae bacterium]|jgi:hypothetical protein